MVLNLIKSYATINMSDDGRSMITENVVSSLYCTSPTINNNEVECSPCPIHPRVARKQLRFKTCHLGLRAVCGDASIHGRRSLLQFNQQETTRPREFALLKLAFFSLYKINFYISYINFENKESMQRGAL